MVFGALGRVLWFLGAGTLNSTLSVKELRNAIFGCCCHTSHFLFGADRSWKALAILLAGLSSLRRIFILHMTRGSPGFLSRWTSLEDCRWRWKSYAMSIFWSKGSTTSTFHSDAAIAMQLATWGTLVLTYILVATNMSKLAWFCINYYFFSYNFIINILLWEDLMPQVFKNKKEHKETIMHYQLYNTQTSYI